MLEQNCSHVVPGIKLVELALYDNKNEQLSTIKDSDLSVDCVFLILTNEF